MVEEVEDNIKQINSQKHTKIAPTRLLNHVAYIL